MEIALLSETIDAAEALRLGLVNRVVAADRLEEETMSAGPPPRRGADACLRAPQAAPAPFVRKRPRRPARGRARSVLRQHRHARFRRGRGGVLRQKEALVRRPLSRPPIIPGRRVPPRPALLHRGHVEVNHVEKPHPRRRARAARDPGARRLPRPRPRRRSAAGRRLRLRHADRRGRLDLPARARPARPRACPRAAGEDDGRRGGRRRCRLRSG